jgi:hypothetical protein
MTPGPHAAGREAMLSIREEIGFTKRRIFVRGEPATGPLRR